ncbi:FAD binding domain-containing protein [Cokeromyces recurvatus]|uniref:FAD binding domain-containing protein n=1 Tax=Cokeromyces recurvatus TaxID=90255 RepID=UPI00221E7B51|nr:FAD binding domain-containing protein [Cokeromyces recurvatus]KAI7900236.1 FAD binding domain-containing protein [Cokeromyces recurvatus]
MTIKVDVLVSGAGPVGLFFTYQLALRGHSVYCIDKKSGPTDQSRAILVTSRTMDILENKALASDILSEAYVPCGLRMFNNGNYLGKINACGDNTHFPHMTILTQEKTEEIIYERIQTETNCIIHWETELVSYTQDDQGVTSIVRDSNTKQEHEVRSAYIVGADGCHSKVRKGNPEWTYEGVAIPTKFALADLVIKGDNIEEMIHRGNMFMKGSDVMGIVPLNRLHKIDDTSYVFRIFGNLEEYHRSNQNNESATHGIVDNEYESNFTLEFLQEWVNRMTAPIKLELSNLIWSSIFRINERMANGFRKKRAFLIGDSAHCHSPAGGQGMNLGLQDADNLAWKMSDVLKNIAANPEELLDSYSAEREPHVKNTIRTTSTATQAGLMANFLANTARKVVLTSVLMVPQLAQLGFKNTMQQYVMVNPSVSNIMGISDKGLIQAGQFLPITDTLRKSIRLRHKSQCNIIQRLTLRDILIHNTSFVAVFIGTCLSSTLPNSALMEKFWKDMRAYHSKVRPIIIQSAWHNHVTGKYPDYITKEEYDLAEESFYSEEQINSPTSITQRVGLYPILSSYFASEQPPNVVLFIRPDLYIAQAKLVANEAQLEEVLKYLSSLYV